MGCRLAEEDSFVVLSQKRNLHAQMEILTNLLNNVVRDMLPPCVLLAVLVAVSCNVLIAKVEGSPFSGLKYPIFITISACYSLFYTVVPFVVFRLAEWLRHNSVQLLPSIQEHATKYNGGHGARRRREAVAFGRMLGARKPLKLYFGHFSAISEGHGTSYVLSILENTVNGFFMVDAKSRVFHLL